ncbi:hypothetical protein [Tropicibacter naphthalenivorans]|uniref:hypothetical protein n=1 Tax=Tropicibacter naphthalenivorans TaxID=441103 RepID=UPI00163FB70C|nr:hypothetical protein [Tropicibacter naphthalenivorans]
MLERFDFEAREAFQHLNLCLGRNRHRHLRIRGEDKAAHLGEAAGQYFRVVREIGS